MREMEKSVVVAMALKAAQAQGPVNPSTSYRVCSSDATDG
jgi:hypothetical protein